MTLLFRITLICCLGVLALPNARAGSVDEAKQNFLTAVKQLEKHNYQAALREFEASYRLNPIPAVLLNVALTHKALGHYADAIESLNRCLADAAQHPKSLSPEQKADGTKLLAELKAKVATHATNHASAHRDETPVEASPTKPAPSLSAATPSAETPAAAAPSAAPPPPQLAQPVHPTSPIGESPTPFVRTARGRAAIGIGVSALAMFAASAVTGGIVLSDRDSYRASCAQVCNNNLYTEAHSFAVSTDVMLGIGGAAAATSLILILTRPKHHTLAVTPSVNARNAGFVLGGAF